MPKTITSVQVNYDDGTSAIMTQGELRSPFAPGGKIVLDAPRAATGPEVAANPGFFDGDPQDPTLTMAPTFWDGEPVPPAPPQHRMCDLFRLDPTLARAVWHRSLNAALDESKLTAAQRKRCGL